MANDRIKQLEEEFFRPGSRPSQNGDGNHKPGGNGAKTARPRPVVETYTAADLLAMELPEPSWAVQGILPEGLSVLGGKPKLGKSWLALNLAVAVATGGCAVGVTSIEPGLVLYLALEDGQRRLQDRLRKLLGRQPGPQPKALTLAHRWPRQDNEGLALLGEWLVEHPQTRLVIIDTWPRFRSARRSKGGAESYEEDYSAAAEVKALADAYHCAILLIAHCRKANSDDWQDELMGSQGLAGAADAAMVLRRERGTAQATLHMTGRDIEEKAVHLLWRPEFCLWEVTETPKEESGSGRLPTAKEKAERWILDQVRAAGDTGAQVGPLIDAGERAGHAKATLWRARGALVKCEAVKEVERSGKKYLIIPPAEEASDCHYQGSEEAGL